MPVSSRPFCSGGAALIAEDMVIWLLPEETGNLITDVPDGSW
ncbi:hypothetical protein [Thermacetogenium phaeum]|nr:hypothetical protein [Thermacetogenium phaeum]